MDKKAIIDAYARIRTIDQTIPDDVLDFMKDAALMVLEGRNPITIELPDLSTKEIVSLPTDKEIFNHAERVYFHHDNKTIEAFKDGVKYMRDEYKKVNIISLQYNDNMDEYILNKLKEKQKVKDNNSVREIASREYEKIKDYAINLPNVVGNEAAAWHLWKRAFDIAYSTLPKNNQ